MLWWITFISYFKGTSATFLFLRHCVCQSDRSVLPNCSSLRIRQLERRAPINKIIFKSSLLITTRFIHFVCGSSVHFSTPPKKWVSMHKYYFASFHFLPCIDKKALSVQIRIWSPELPFKKKKKEWITNPTVNVLKTSHNRVFTCRVLNAIYSALLNPRFWLARKCWLISLTVVYINAHVYV